MSGTARSLSSHPETAERTEDTARLGMVLFLGSWAMLFASLFFAYGVLRLRQPSWPPFGTPPLPKGLPLLNTAVLAVNAMALQRALSAARGGRASQTVARLWEALVSGSVFLLLQILLWKSLAGAGLALSDGPLAALVYGLTGVHAVHVAVGLLGLGWLLLATGRAPWNGRPALRLRMWARYWHFVFLVWLALYLLLFVL